MLRRGEMAIIPCRNGKKTAELIHNHLKEICSERKDILSKRKNSFTLYEHRQLEFIDYVDKYGIEIINPDIKDFKDGEISITITESVRGKNVYIVQNTLDPENPKTTSHNIMELVLMVETARRSFANEVTVIMPYMSYSKQERRQGRQPISAKVLLDILNDSGADKLMTMELHAPAIEGFTGAKHLTVENLFASSRIIDYFVGKKKFAGLFVAPDAGAGKMVGHYSKVTGLPLALGYKFRRPDSRHDSEEQKLLGDVKGQEILIIDDQVATGGTIINIAKVAKEKGATKAYAAVTHGLLLGDAENKFQKAVKENIIDELVITNTVIHSEDFMKRNKYITPLCALKMFAQAVFESEVDGSVSRLYDVKLRKSMFGTNHHAPE